MAKESLIRIGRVSSVDYSAGMMAVTYPDRDGSVTAEIPAFSFTDEYKMPPIGADVLVLHLSNGQAAGIVMGRYWNKRNRPQVDGVPYALAEGVFRKELGQSHGEAFISYSGGTLTIHADRIVLDAKHGVTADGITASGDVTAAGKSLSAHTHTDSQGGGTSAPN